MIDKIGGGGDGVKNRTKAQEKWGGLHGMHRHTVVNAQSPKNPSPTTTQQNQGMCGSLSHGNGRLWRMKARRG